MANGYDVMKVSFMRSNLKIGDDASGFVNCSSMMPPRHLQGAML
jgi:hypothetical protein